VPRRFAVGDAEPEYPDTPYDYFKPIYYEALDLIINCIKSDLISQGTRFTASCSNYCSNQLREKTTKMNCSLLDHFMVLSFSDQLECQLQTFTHLCHEKPITLQTTALYAHVLQQYCEHFTTSFLIKLSLIAYLSHFTVHVKE